MHGELDTGSPGVERLHLVGAEHTVVRSGVRHRVLAGHGAVVESELLGAMGAHHVVEVIRTECRDGEVDPFVHLNEHTEFEVRCVVEHSQGRTRSFGTDTQCTGSTRNIHVLNHRRYIFHEQVEVLVVHLVLKVSACRHVVTCCNRDTQLNTCCSDETEATRACTELKGQRNLYHVDVLTLAHVIRRRGHGVQTPRLGSVLIIGRLCPRFVEYGLAGIGCELCTGSDTHPRKEVVVDTDACVPCREADAVRRYGGLEGRTELLEHEFAHTQTTAELEVPAGSDVGLLVTLLNHRIRILCRC